MKIKKGFILRKMGDQHLVVAVGEAAKKFKGMMRLNETSAFLWEQLSDHTTIDALVEKLLSEYDTDPDTARADVTAFVAKLKSSNLLDE